MTEKKNQTNELQEDNGVLEDVTPEGSVEQEGADIPMPTPGTPVEPDFFFPKEFNIDVPLSELSNEALADYHDLTHIFWNKYERGTPMNFGFTQLIVLHKKAVGELERRGFSHFGPINALDLINISPAEMQQHSEELSKKNSQRDANLSFEPPIITSKKEI